MAAIPLFAAVILCFRGANRKSTKHCMLSVILRMPQSDALKNIKNLMILVFKNTYFTITPYQSDKYHALCNLNMPQSGKIEARVLRRLKKLRQTRKNNAKREAESRVF